MRTRSSNDPQTASSNIKDLFNKCSEAIVRWFLNIKIERTAMANCNNAVDVERHNYKG